MLVLSIFTALLTTAVAVAQQTCPGYRATNVTQSASGLTADLELAGSACDIYGQDLPNLTLTVEYQTASRLHVLIQDSNQTVYQVPNYILPRPSGSLAAPSANLRFNYTKSPFSFSVSRVGGEVIFNTSGSPLVFESQYLNLRTSLPQQPNLYGLGEHTDPFRLNTTNYTRTFWARDAYEVPTGTNLYGTHPIYLDHRGATGTHGVIFVNSNGMDIKINDTSGQYLEYNTLGGVFDFYFVAGPSPTEVAQQISEVVGLPAMIPYAGLGYHNCRYGYRDVYEVAEVVYNYSAAGIPLETMWTDIDYMDRRRTFSLDPERFPLEKMRELVNYLHAHQQNYVVMVDPAVVNTDYEPFTTGLSEDIFLKTSNGSIYQGVVWGGVSVFPDWFHPDAQSYWSGQFDSFFNKDTGVDIDFLWIDMNEPSNFCNYPCSDPAGFAEENDDPPAAPEVRPNGPDITLPGFPADFQPGQTNSTKRKRQTIALGSMQGLPGRNLIDPPYQINNAAGSISNKTAATDIVHYNGLVEYDTHNLYGAMMSNASRQAMESRRPGLRPLIITRSTFLGAGSYVGHWLGDNVSDWPNYRVSISEMMMFSAMFQIPMVGADVCGFASNTTEYLCARWMMLGAFSPFYRNHNEYGSLSQEAYRWPSVTAAAKYAIDIRYRLMDYFYTALYTQTKTGTPSLNPMFYVYPTDSNTFGLEHQFFFGNAVLVSPVVEENSTSVVFYLPNDIFYDWNNGFIPVQGNGSNVTLHNVDFQTIPLHVRGGTILPLRTNSANTTTELRKQNFNIVIAPSVNGTASGSLYLDEGSMLEQPSITMVNMTFSNGTFRMSGNYGYAANVSIEAITILGVTTRPASISELGGQQPDFMYNSSTQAVTISTNISLTADMTLSVLATLASEAAGAGGSAPSRAAVIVTAPTAYLGLLLLGVIIMVSA